MAGLTAADWCFAAGLSDVSLDCFAHPVWITILISYNFKMFISFALFAVIHVSSVPVMARVDAAPGRSCIVHD